MSLKKLFITFLSAGLLISLQTPALGDGTKPIDEQWKRTAPSKPGQYGILIQQSLELLRFSSYLISLNGSKDKVESVTACKSFTDPLCAKTVIQQMSANLQLCSEKITSECVTGGWARSARGPLGSAAHSLACGRWSVHVFFEAAIRPCGSPHQMQPGH